jgi:hypothetical protein
VKAVIEIKARQGKINWIQHKEIKLHRNLIAMDQKKSYHLLCLAKDSQLIPTKLLKFLMIITNSNIIASSSKEVTNKNLNLKIGEMLSLMGPEGSRRNA